MLLLIVNTRRTWYRGREQEGQAGSDDERDEEEEKRKVVSRRYPLRHSAAVSSGHFISARPVVSLPDGLMAAH